MYSVFRLGVNIFTFRDALSLMGLKELFEIQYTRSQQMFNTTIMQREKLYFQVLSTLFNHLAILLMRKLKLDETDSCQLINWVIR